MHYVQSKENFYVTSRSTKIMEISLQKGEPMNKFISDTTTKKRKPEIAQSPQIFNIINNYETNSHSNVWLPPVSSLTQVPSSG